MSKRKHRATLALLLLVPVPSLGVLAALVLFPDSTLGRAIFLVGKIWFFSFPAAWHLLVERGSPSFSPMRRGGLGVGALTGLAVSLLILTGYLLFGDLLLEPSLFVEKMSGVGLATVPAFVGGAAYWILVNSVLEEYAWRWFVVQQSARLFGPRLAILFSASCFTVHHAIALATYLPPAAVALCSAGIFVGGWLWSLLYVRYLSIWPAYLSHALVDLCIFGIAASMLF